MNEDDFTSDLPEGWVHSSIGEAFQVNPTKPPTDELSKNAPVTFVPMSAVDAASGSIVTPQEKAFARVRKGYTAFRENDVIFAKITPCMENGKAAIARNLTNGIGFGSTEFHVLRTHSAVLPEFLFHFVRRQTFRIEAKGHMTGSVGQKRVPKKFLENAHLPVPPLAEQKRIVAKLEEFLSNIEKTKRHIERVPQIVTSFRKAVLGAACSGRLTEDWREKHSKYEPWKQVDFFDFCILQRGYDLPIKKCKPGPYHVVSSSGIVAHHSEFKAKGPGVTVGRSGSTGKVHYVNEDFWPHNTNLFVKDFKGNLPKYVYYFLLGFNFQRFSASTAVPTLNRNTLRGVKVKVPPVDEQVEIVRQVERLFELANSIERRVKTATEKTEKLTQSILSKAFRGELVPTEAELARRQGRTYETAVQLLKRIKLEREKKRTIELKVSEKIKVRSKVMGVLRGLKKRPILEVLSEAQGKLKPEELFRKANFTEEYIDDFYEELRAAVQAGQIKESRPKKTEIYLEAVKT